MIAIIANPNALHFDKNILRKIAIKLNKDGMETDIFFTKNAGDGTKIADKLAGRYKIIVAYGGDGIINEVINADLKDSALGILPAGTTNVLAVNLKINPNTQKAAELFRNPNFIDAYPVCINNKKFILMASSGFDAESVKNLNEKLKKISGKFSYFWAGVVSYILNLKLKSRTINVDIGDKTYKARWVIASKAKKYAGNFNISNFVDIDIPLIDVCLFKPILHPLFDLPLFNAALFSGMHLFEPPFVKHIITDKSIKIEKSTIQIDGDFFGYTEAYIKICRKPIRIVVP